MLEPGNSFAGVGIWHPDRPTLSRIRDALVERPRAWRAARDDADFPVRYAESCRAAAPFVRFLCAALDVPF